MSVPRSDATPPATAHPAAAEALATPAATGGVAAADPLAPGPRTRLGNSFAALLLGAVAIGFAPIFVRLSETDPVATACWRVILALPCLWIAALVTERRPDPAADHGTTLPPGERRGAAWLAMAVAGLFFSADLAVWHWSIRFTSVANSTMLANLAPVFVVLYAWVAFRERVSRRFLLAMIVALAGLVLLIGRDFRLDARALWGDALGIVTAVFYAGYIVSIKALRGRFGTLSIMARTSAATLLGLVPIMLLSPGRFWPQTARGWGAVIGLALVSHVGGQCLITYALAKLPASVASVSLLIQPVTAALAAAVLLGESVLPVQAAGMALVLAGVFVARQEVK